MRHSFASGMWCVVSSKDLPLFYTLDINRFTHDPRVSNTKARFKSPE